MKRRWKKAAATVIAVALLLVIFTILRPGPEPTYHGKTLTYWMDETESDDPDSARAAGMALRHIGQGAVPFLDHAINRKNSKIQKGYRVTWLLLPAFFERRLPRPEPGIDGLNKPFLALALVGSPAMPGLTRQLESPDEAVSLYALIALAAIGEPAVPALTAQLRSRRAGTRQAAARALGLLGQNASAAVPALTNCLSDSSPEVRAEANLALQGLGSEMYDPLARLLAQIGEDAARLNLNAGIRDYIRMLSLQIGSDAQTPIPELMIMFGTPHAVAQNLEKANAAVLPMMVKRLSHSNAVVRTQAAAALARAKPSPMADMPFYEAAIAEVNGTNPLARQEAAFAMWRRGSASSMIDLLIKELQSASDLETGARILDHFAQMGDAIKPSIPVISNIVTASPRLRSFSNEVWRLDPSVFE